ncbi:MAG: hypothetical protein WAM73_02360 [Desulfobacterales bacterium]
MHPRRSSQYHRDYLSCPRYKGHHKKHVAVCERCSRKGGCAAYRRYRQPELPFKPATAVNLPQDGLPEK